MGFEPGTPGQKANTITTELKREFSLMQLLGIVFNPLPNNKILDLSKFNAFADDKIILTHKLKFVLRRVENIVGKGENAGYQHFLLFPHCFQKLSSSEALKVGIVR